MPPPRSKALNGLYWSVLALLCAFNLLIWHDDSAYLLLDLSPRLCHGWLTWFLMMLKPGFLPGPEWIRLVQLHCDSVGEGMTWSIHKYNFQDAPSYHALSYTWGPAWAEEGPNTTQSQYGSKTLWFRRRQFPVNMVGAIHTLCPLNLTTHYWIDAVCIYQHNHRERSDQVGNMDKVFQQAEAVDVWLGPGHEIVDRLNTTLRKFVVDQHLKRKEGSLTQRGERSYRHHPSILDGKKMLGEEDWIALVHLFSRRWFHRLWTLQEFALATKVNVWCGTTLLDWNTLQEAARYLNDARMLMRPKYGRSGIGGTAIVHLTALQDAIRNPKAIDFSFLSCLSSSESHEDPDYESILAWVYWRSITTFATDTRDYIYGIIGVSNAIADSLGLKYESHIADYSLNDIEAFQAFTVRLMNSRLGLAAMFLTQPSRYEEDERSESSVQRTPNLPSWVPDFAHREHFGLSSNGGLRGGAECKSVFGIKSPTELPPLIRDRELYLRCHRIGHVPDLSGGIANFSEWRLVDRASEHRLCSNFVIEWLSILHELPETYSRTQQSPLEVLAATLALGEGPGNLEPDETLALVTWMLLTIHVRLQSEMFMPEFRKASAFMERPPMPWSMPPRLSALFPPKESVRSLHRGRPRTVDMNHDREYRKFLQEGLDNCRLYWHRYPRMYGQRLFLLEHGEEVLLGAGPETMSAGDSIWACAGSMWPVILRSHRESGLSIANRAYQLVGEAYVHGIMHGELFDDANPVFEEIVLR